MRFPNINDVAAELREINKTNLQPEDADDGIDVRLQVYPDGEWAVRSGSSDYDQDHRGYWGASSVPGDNRRFNSKDVARDLIDQAKDAHAEGAGFEEPAQTVAETSSKGMQPFRTWADVLAHAAAGRELYYRAPMDVYPTRLLPGRNMENTYEARSRTIRIWPTGSVGRGSQRTSDPFTADSGHLDRFLRPSKSVSETYEKTVETPRGASKDTEELRRILEKGVMLDEDRVDGSVDLNDPSPVYVGIIFDVDGYGPHVGAMYVDQNRYHTSADTALQAADEILTEWKLEHYPEHLEDLEKEFGDEGMDVFTETFDGLAFELAPQDFVNAIQRTDAEKYIDVEPIEEEEDLEEPSVREVSEMRFNKDDERVFAAFLARRSARGKRFETNGQRLDGGAFLSNVASWETLSNGREAVVLHDLGSRTAQQIHRRLKRMGGPIVKHEHETGASTAREARNDPWKGQSRRPSLPDMRLIDQLAVEVDNIRREQGITVEQAYDAIERKPDWFRRYYMSGGDKIYLENLIINRAKQLARGRGRAHERMSENRVAERDDGSAPTAQNILEWLGPYMEHDGLDAPRESARLARLIKNARTSRQAEEVLEEVNRVIGGHGVEAVRIEDAYIDNYYFDIAATYVNMGDTYTPTLLHESATGRFVLTSWGDWFEAHEAEYLPEEEEEEEPDWDDGDLEEGRPSADDVDWRAWVDREKARYDKKFGPGASNDVNWRAEVEKEKARLDRSLHRKYGARETRGSECPQGSRSYNAKYVHPISPKPTDTGGPFCIRDGAWSDSKTLAAALRKAGVLDSGARVRHFRIEGDKIVVFPMMPGLSSYWHSVTLTPND